MPTGTRAALAASLVVFLLFLANVAFGGAAATTFLGDVGEAVVLFVAVFLFVVAILLAERARDAGDNGR